jgi:hypothetical protein
MANLGRDSAPPGAAERCIRIRQTVPQTLAASVYIERDLFDHLFESRTKLLRAIADEGFADKDSAALQKTEYPICCIANKYEPKPVITETRSALSIRGNLSDRNNHLSSFNRISEPRFLAYGDTSVQKVCHICLTSLGNRELPSE